MISLVFDDVITGFPASIVVSEVFSPSTFTSFVIAVLVPSKSLIIAFIVNVLIFSCPGSKSFTFHVTTPFSKPIVSCSAVVDIIVASLYSNSLGIWSVITASPAVVPLFIAVIVYTTS